jgi:hypothetical protein
MRSFQRVLTESAMLRATRTLNRRSPRMVKRRNSPYAPHDKAAKTRVQIDVTPGIVPRADGPPEPARHRPPRMWSAGNPEGRFVN